jgi:hypothetical protein
MDMRAELQQMMREVLAETGRDRLRGDTDQAQLLDGHLPGVSDCKIRKH